MGFYIINEERKKKGELKINIDLINKFGCSCCYLKAGVKSSDMQPTGSDIPDVYILGGSPSKADDDLGESFGGTSGDLLRPILRKYFGRKFMNTKIRYNNTVRCRIKESDGSSRQPKATELEFCRKSVVDDIQRTKPKVIFGFSDTVLTWVFGAGCGRSGLWRGRKVPIKIGGHVCWFFPMLHPKDVLKNKKKYGYDKLVHVFDFDIKNASNFLINDYKSPIYIEDEDEIKEGIHLLYDVEEIRKTLSRLNDENDYLSIDIENYPLRPYADDAQILCMSVSNFKETYAFMYNKETSSLFEYFLFGKARKIAHNLQHEIEWFLKMFAPSTIIENVWEDTMSQAYVLDERKEDKSNRGLLSLNDLSKIYFGFSLKDFSGIIYKDVRTTNEEALLSGCGLDAKWTYKLYEEQHKLIEGTKLHNVYRKHVEAAVGLSFTQNRGVLVDFDIAKENSDGFLKEFEKVKNELKSLPEIIEFERIFGRKFNPRSADRDLPDLFINQLKLDKFESKNKRGYSLNEPALSSYAEKGVKSAEVILRCREWGGLFSKYEPAKYDKYDGSYVHDDFKIHTNFLHLFTESGRLSSRGPNLQNLDNNEHKHIRNMFIAPDGTWITAFDYGQMQVRLIGVESNDKVLLQYCTDDHDFHMEFAKEFAYLYPQAIGGKRYINDAVVMKAFRKKVKSVFVFAKFFGSVDDACAMRLGIPVEHVRTVSNKLWKMFHRVKEWHKEVFNFYLEKGYVESRFGRRRRAPLTVNQIINTSIQGLEIELVNSALWRLVKQAYYLDKPQYIPVISIHDDLTFYLPKDTLEDDVSFIGKEMVRIPDELNFITLPLTLDVELGSDWYGMEKLTEFSTIDFNY